MTNTENWRDKYRSVTLELEACEKKQKTLIDQVRSLATQLNLAVNGQNPNLDDVLSQLTAKANAGESERLNSLLQQSEKYIRRLDESRVQVSNRGIGQLKEWAVLLQQQDHGGAHAAAFREFENQLGESAEKNHAIPGLIGILLEIEKSLTSQDRGVIDQNDLAHQEGLYGARLAASLLGLIQRLSIPPAYSNRVHTLIARLENSPGTDELEACLKEAGELAQLSGSGADADIQEYLSGLNEQLSFLRHFFESNEVAEQKQRKRNNLLDLTVRGDVQKIHQTVQKSQDIAQLKKAVNTQLVSIIKAMNQHKVAENERFEAFQAEKKSLLSRLDAMEKQSEHLRICAEEAHVKSRIDPLTGLGNRLDYEQQLNLELERFMRYGTVFSLCIADIDFFKRINDDYGHLAGDKVLRLMAKILRANLRNVDYIGRFGGEEFVILMPSTNGESAKQAAEKVREAIENSPFNFHSKPVQITLSIGITEVQADDTPDSLFARADAQLYVAKSKGRNRVYLG